MTTEELAKRRAWATCPFGDKNLTDEELATATYMPSENFSDGWDKGSDYALSHQWISVDERLPESPYNDVLVFIPASPALSYSDRHQVAYYDGEDWYTTDGEHIRPTHWMEIPKLNPEKE